MEELIKPFFPEKYYTITQHENSIHSHHQNDPCVELLFNWSKQEIVLDFLTNCGIKNGGTIHLQRVIEFSKFIKQMGFHHIKITDVSGLNYLIQQQVFIVSLPQLKLLQSGSTWYENLDGTSP